MGIDGSPTPAITILYRGSDCGKGVNRCLAFFDLYVILKQNLCSYKVSVRKVKKMLVIDVMTRNVITVEKDTPVGEAQRIMKEHNIRRLPVVDDKGRPIGVVTAERLERIKPRSATPLLWQITYLLSHTTVSDVMRKRVVTVKPTDSVEQAIAKAQAAKVGTVIVVEKGKIVGICSTNDFLLRDCKPNTRYRRIWHPYYYNRGRQW